MSLLLPSQKPGSNVADVTSRSGAGHNCVAQGCQVGSSAGQQKLLETTVKTKSKPTVTTKELDVSTPSLASRATGETTGALPINDDAVTILQTGKSRQKGIFALHDFPAKHTIIKERPMFSCVYWPQRNGVQTIINDWVRMKPQQQQTIRNTFWRLKDIPVGKKPGVLDRRKLRKFVEDYAFWDSMRTNAHIYRLASHINHACVSCANAQQWTDAQWPNYITIKLVKPVKAGEEIFINYNKSQLPFGCAVCKSGSRDWD